MIETLIQADQYLFSVINGLAGQIGVADNIVLFVIESYVLKGVPVMMVWWGLWFLRSPMADQNRQYLLAGLLASIAAIFAGRSLSLTLPFRYRPLHDPEFEVNLPGGMSDQILTGWSSFPSDHAVLFFAMAAAIFLVHRTLGLVLFLHAATVISLPRIYTAWHFPGDILFGAFVGISITLLLVFPVAGAIKKLGILQLIERYSHFSYPIIFFITFQAASMFDSSRDLIRLIASLTSALMGRIVW